MGEARRPALPPDDRPLLLVLIARVARRSHVTADGCWRYDGGKTRQGYGVGGYQRAGGRYTYSVHRLAHMVFSDEIPPGLQIDHLCRTRDCWNPAHLQAVTPRVNTLRGETMAAARAAKTHCRWGHPFAGANLRVRPDRRRVCKACHNRETLAAWHRKRDAARATQDAEGAS